MLLEDLRPHIINLKGWDKGACTGSLLSRLQVSGAERAGLRIFFPVFSLSVYCCLGSGVQANAWHWWSSIIFTTYPKMLQAKFPAAVTFLCCVRTARGALTSFCLSHQGAGNASFSPSLIKNSGLESCQRRGGSTRQVSCSQLPVVVSPQGKAVI